MKNNDFNIKCISATIFSLILIILEFVLKVIDFYPSQNAEGFEKVSIFRAFLLLDFSNTFLSLSYGKIATYFVFSILFAIFMFSNLFIRKKEVFFVLLLFSFGFVIFSLSLITNSYISNDFIFVILSFIILELNLSIFKEM